MNYLEIKDSELYHFDPIAAERPIKFVEQYCCNYEDKWQGQPWLLFDFQKHWMRSIYGWKRADNRRRFKEVFAELPKGNGKSPWLSLCGLYELLASGEHGAWIISAAVDFKQANITFDCAKKIILNSPRLAAMVETGEIDVNQFEIKYLPTNSKWEIMSGNFEGKAGFRPTCVLLDEAWEWPNRKMYDSITRNSKKRSEPLIFVATNSGNRKDSICWELHERALNILSGKSKDDTLYPIVYCADEKEEPTEELWQRVNPALDKIISMEALREEFTKAKETPSLMPEFRRLHCGQWILGGAEKWLDMVSVTECTRKFKPSELEGLTWMLGLDPSLSDDLTALVMVGYSTLDKPLYVRSKFWLPRKTAFDYEDRAGIPYTNWADQKHITLVDADTIDANVQEQIAKTIIRLTKKFNVRALCYDVAKAANIVALCEKAGVVCVPIPQGFKLSQSLFEIDRRIKDRSIVFSPNEVMSFCLQNAEIKTGDLGGIRLVKEGASGKWKGNPAFKIDGVQALSTAVHQVRFELMQPPQPSVYESRGVFVV